MEEQSRLSAVLGFFKTVGLPRVTVNGVPNRPTPGQDRRPRVTRRTTAPLQAFFCRFQGGGEGP